MHLPRSMALALTLSFCTLAVPAVAQGPGQPTATPPPSAKPVRDPGPPPRRPAREVPGLSQQQRERIAKLRLETREKLAPHRQRLMGERRELQALWSAEVPSRDAILKKLESIDTVRRAMRPVLVESRVAYLALLTAQQRKAAHRPCEPMRHAHGRQRMGGMSHPESPLGTTAPGMGPCAAEAMDPWADSPVDDDGAAIWEMGDCPASEPGAPPPEKAPAP